MADIIDASVAIKWFVVEEGRDRALAWLKKILDRPRDFAVPELFFFELSNIFNRLIPSPDKTQVMLLENLFVLGVHRLAMTKELYTLQTQFQALGLSGYDASYVAAAKLLKGKWITFDEKAHKKIQKMHLSMLA